LGHGLVTAPALAPLHGLLPPLLHSRAERWLGRIGAINGAEIFEPGYRRMLQRGLEPEWSCRVFMPLRLLV
jgi:hypothetical protein